EWVRNTVVNTANNQLIPTLSVENISGDLWNGATLTNIVLTDRENTIVASIDTLQLAYSPLSYFSDVFRIQEVRLNRPFVNLEQQSDSTWNVQNWMQPPGASPDTTSDPFGFLLGRLVIESGAMDVSMSPLQEDSSFVIEDMNLSAGISYFGDRYEASVSAFNARIVHTRLGAPITIEAAAAISETAATLQLAAVAEGIEQFRVAGRIRGGAAMELTSLELSASQLDLEAFTGDTTMPSLQNLSFKAAGSLPLDRYQEARLHGTLSAENIRQGVYGIDLLQGSFTWENEAAKIRLEPSVGQEEMILTVEMSQLWGGQPFIRITVSGSEINPANWLQGEAYAGNVSFEGKAGGPGWYPGEQAWDYQLSVDKSRLMDQRLDYAEFSGRFSRQMVTNRSRVRLEESQLVLKAEARQLQAKPAFSYTLNGSDINLADFAGLEGYPSSISFSLEGEGRGEMLQNLDMQNSIRIDSSIFLGEAIRNFSADTRIQNAVMTVQNGVLESNFAEGNFNGRMHLEKIYDTANTLNLGIRLKDLSSFASVADVEVLQATGNIDGKLTTNGRDLMVFEGGINLDNVNYNNQFTAPEIFGGIRFDLSENPEYMADVEITAPSVASVALKNVRLKTEGQRTATTINGSYEFEVADAHDDRISQTGGYRMSGDSLSIEMTGFDLTTPARTLSLQEPFNITWAGNTLRTDTLRISNKDRTAFMELAVPLADSLHQRGYLKAEELNLKAIQNAMLDNVYLEGMLFGELHVDRTDTSLAASGDLLMSNIQYGETGLDSLLLQATVEKDRLEGLMELRQDGDIIAEGDLNIPFKAGDPELLDSSFFEQPVSGTLALHAVRLGRFSALLEEAGYENTEGILQFEGSLEGKAGQPELGAALNLRNALLSGVPVDSLVASMDYQHSQSSLNLNAVLTSLKQKALYADARMPLDIDLRTWEVGLPDPRDSISVAVQTNQFNLKALNDFLDQNMMRNLQGRIDGQVEIEGPRNNLQTSGEISLQEGAVRLVPVNIRLDNIRSTLRFKPGEIELTGLSMNSGGGNLSAGGTVALNKLVPGNID
ncbi:MAG TPA: hypothetical protein VK074_01615, partial [Fodinibius sp.]|nr:hypothetical protein [Fodinibius sp.]